MMNSRFSTLAALRHVLLTLALIATAVFASAAPASATNSTPEELINFSTGDPATDPGTEGIAVDRQGNIYVTANTADGGQVWKIAPGGTEPEVLATLIPPTGGAGFGALGIHLVGRELLVATHTLADPDLNGVWRVNRRTGDASHIAGSEVIGLPNDLTTWRSKIYVTDSVGGAVWVIDREGVRVWAQDELLEGLGELVPGVPIGANGIDASHGRLYIANLEKGLVLQARLRGRNAATPSVYAEVDGAPDGLEVDRYGRPHVVLIDKNSLVRLSRRGTSTIIEDSNVLDAPSSLVFGNSRSRRGAQTAYVVNFSISEGFPDALLPSSVGPSVVAVSPSRRW